MTLVNQCININLLSNEILWRLTPITISLAGIHYSDGDRLPALSAHTSPPQNRQRACSVSRYKRPPIFIPASYLALPGSPPHSASASLGALAPAWPARPESKSGITGTHPLLLVTVHTRAVARRLRDVVHGVIANVAAGAVIANQEVLEVSLKNDTTFTKWIIGLSVNLIGNLDTLLLQLIGS